MQHLDEGTIHAWLDGALTADEARQAEAHVAACAACADAVAEARGLIAASSMILSKLDGVMPERDVQSAGPDLSIRDIAVARAEAAVRPRTGVRRWFAGSPMRAAAAVLILAGGVAIVGNVTGRDELAGVVADAAMESADVAADSAGMRVASGAAQDATAAGAEEPEAPPAPPTVAAAPALPRPVPVVGGGAASRQAPARAPVRVADGGLAGIGAAGAESREATTATAAPAAPALGGGTSAAVEEERGARRLEERLRRVEQPQERDFAEAAKAGAPAPPSPAAAAAAPAPSQPPTANQAAPVRENLRRVDSTLALQSVRTAAEPDPLRQRLASKGAAAPSGRLDRAEAAASDQPTVLLAPRCYALTLAPWSPVTAPAPAEPFTRIFLAPDTGTAGPATGQRLVRPMTGAAAEGYAAAYAAAWWTEVSPSTLVLTWATGSEGIVMRLLRSGSGLSGTARTFGTSGGVERTSNVTGTAVDCGEAR